MGENCSNVAVLDCLFAKNFHFHGNISLSECLLFKLLISDNMSRTNIYGYPRQSNFCLDNQNQLGRWSDGLLVVYIKLILQCN